MKIGIVGNGFVGQATKILSLNEAHELFVYDKDPDKCEPLYMTIEDMLVCDVIFVAVPQIHSPLFQFS